MPRRQRLTLLGLAAAVAVVAVLVLVVAGGDDEDEAVIDTRTQTTATRAQATGTAPATTNPAPAPVVVVRDGRPVAGVEVLRFRKGGRIRFDVRSDTAEEVHLHGYDVSREVAAGGAARFSLPATIDGRFEVELHHTGAQVAEVRVIP